MKAYAAEGYRIIQLVYRPGSCESEARIDVGGVEVEVLACIHDPGPAECWCRKPLPGLGVLLIEKHALDPGQCIVVGESAADRSFAERLGFRLVSADQFFRIG